jgi:hypothetical protein
MIYLLDTDHGGDYEQEITAVQKLLAPFLLYDYESVVCPAHYGRLRSALESKGAPIGAMDILIAAHAFGTGRDACLEQPGAFLPRSWFGRRKPVSEARQRIGSKLTGNGVRRQCSGYEPCYNALCYGTVGLVGRHCLAFG